MNRYISCVLAVLCLMVLEGVRADVNLDLLSNNLMESIKHQTSEWPEKLILKVNSEERKFLSQATKLKTIEEYEKLRLAYREKQRDLAKGVYGADTLVWNIMPDDDFTMLSLPESLKPIKKASLETVVNALEAVAFGVANLSDSEELLEVTISSDPVSGSPLLTPRMARFSRTKDSRYVPDVLLAMDGSRSIPSGESRLLWIGVESTGSNSGTYQYKINIKVGKHVHYIPLEIIVHDVTLSKETPLTTFNWAYLDSGYNNLTYKKARETMLSHRITTGANTATGNPEKNAEGKVIRPVKIDYTKLDQFIEFNKDFPQISFYWSFHRKANPPTRDMFGDAVWMSDEYKAIFKEWLVCFVTRLREKGRDYDRFYLQMFDETTDDKLAQITKLVHQIDPKVRMMITISSTADPKKILDEGMNIVVYHSPYLGHKSAPASFNPVLSAGSELWLYNAGNRTRNGRDRDPLNIYRLLHWLAFRHDATGVGFWNMFHDKKSAWADDEQFYPLVYTVPDVRGYPVPSDVKTSEMVIPSRRLEYVRMGIEDYMLLKMAQEKISKLGKDSKSKFQLELDALVKSVTKDLPKHTSNKMRREFRNSRKLLINLIERLAPQ